MKEGNDVNPGSYKSWTFPEVSSPNTIDCSKPDPVEEEEVVEIEEDVEIESLEQDITELVSAEQLQSITEEAHKEGFQSGYQEGKQTGYDVGKKEGLLAGQGEIDEKLKRLDNLIQALMIPLKGEQEKLEKTILVMVVQLVRSIVDIEMKTDSSVIVKTVKQCLLALPHMTKHLTLYLNSCDHQMLKDSRLLDDYDYQIIDDDELIPGGCRLVSNDTSIDNTLETKLDIIIQEFLNQPKPASDGAIDAD